MQALLPADLFATKGIEYLLVIGFLVVLSLFWWLLTRREPAQPDRSRPRPRAPGSWFGLVPEFFYHPGHSWAAPGPDGLVTVGIDDFAQKLVGPPTAVELPEIGASVEQGGRGTRLRVQSEAVDLLSPVDGKVVARNSAVLERPELIQEDPYGEGWLVKVAPSRMKSNFATLLHQGLAAAWLEVAENNLRRRMSGELGMVLQDGGVPVNGIARSMAGDDWQEFAGDFLLNSFTTVGPDESVEEHAAAP